MNTRKDIRIENASWDQARMLIKKNKIEDIEGGFRSINELISSLLVMHKEKKITVEPYKAIELRPKKITLSEEALAYYLGKNLEGERTYLINGLLRVWLKENKENS